MALSIPATCTRITLAERPTNHITTSTFKQLHSPLSPPAHNQALVHVLYLSIDPAMRGWLNDTRSYIPPVQIGATMRAGGLGSVLAAGPDSIFKPGDIVYGDLGWCDYVVLDDSKLEKIEPAPKTQLLDYLGILGPAGLTAYFGVLDVLRVKPGDTMVVSGAAGAVGSLALQLGKLLGARVVGIAGGPAKCAYLSSALGADLALDYKAKEFRKEFRERVGRCDVYFDNVGGEMLDFVLTRLEVGGRVALCGAIADYNTPHPHGLRSYLALISTRATLQGFIVFDYAPRFASARAELARWLAEGKLKTRFTVVEGLERAPSALEMLFEGGNMGKTVLKVAGAPATAKSKL